MDGGVRELYVDGSERGRQRTRQRSLLKSTNDLNYHHSSLEYNGNDLHSYRESSSSGTRDQNDSDAGNDVEYGNTMSSQRRVSTTFQFDGTGNLNPYWIHRRQQWSRSLVLVYFVLALIDVEANYLLVMAYRYTSMLSVMVRQYPIMDIETT
jgi:hypothetical protein